METGRQVALMSDNRKEAGGSPPSSGEPGEQREDEPGITEPFGPERHGAASILPPAHEQGRRAYADTLSANDMQRRRIAAAALAGARSTFVPPQPPPENRQPVLSSGVVTAVGISIGQNQTGSVVPTPIPIGLQYALKCLVGSKL